MDGETGAGLMDGAEVYGRVAEIGRAAWDACAEPTGDPFLSFDFLYACEESGSAVERTGWGPRHLVVRDAAGAVAGCLPLYLKGHSSGEYVFDHAWAQAFMQAGGRYYPKLLSAVPFTPVTGPRLLVRPDADAAAVRERLIAGVLSLAERLGVSSAHVNFPTEADRDALVAAGFLPRQDVQYWWTNAGYGSFEDFLAALSSNRRKTIRRERRDANEGLEVEVLTGADLTEAVWDAFFAFYMDTGARKWGRPYLTRRFFSLIGETMADRIALVLARRGGEPIAGALNFVGRDALYGRQWGALAPAPFLHFELCYYRAIEFAIERGLSRVEAGAQGEHKIARGYLPTPVHSAHWIADPGFRRAVSRYPQQERTAVALETEALAREYSPYRRA
jgi:predicted N-acyltransferase